MLTVKRMFSACAGLVLMLSHLGGCDSTTERLGRWDNQAIDSTNITGLKLVRHISDFQVSHGRYPATLDELGLNLSDFPPLVGDQVWRYKVFSGGSGFELLVRSKPGEHEMLEYVYDASVSRFTRRDI